MAQVLPFLILFPLENGPFRLISVIPIWTSAGAPWNCCPCRLQKLVGEFFFSLLQGKFRELFFLSRRQSPPKGARKLVPREICRKMPKIMF